MMSKVQNVWCAMLNYRSTAREVDSNPPSEPIFFLKAGSSVINESQPIILPDFSQEVLYEIEIALQFNERLEVGSIGLALDLTAWDVYQRLDAHSFPYTLAKSFKNACPVGKFLPLEDFNLLNDTNFSLEVNGVLRQKGNTNDMVFSPRELVSYLCDHFPVCPNDILLTGTPAGVAQINRGDHLVGRIADFYTARWTVSF